MTSNWQRANSQETNEMEHEYHFLINCLQHNLSTILLYATAKQFKEPFQQQNKVFDYCHSILLVHFHELPWSRITNRQAGYGDDSMCNDKTIHRLICLITQKEITKTEVNHVAGNGKKRAIAK